jgi:tetratricopeptide (TPR) repeat protein
MIEPSEREVRVFSAARQLPLDQRQAYLDETCAEDATLRQRVEDLLQASEEVGTFLQAPAVAAKRTGEAAVSQNLSHGIPKPLEKIPERIGRYKLLQPIGHGGCGVVYMAEQEEPVRRRVALKVIKLGMDTKSVIARFEAERQALALMDHPNIAKVLDAGATETGRPYFVMELVRGIRITDFCDQNKLSMRQRLDLFVQVCQAVQHAHQKGVIHRDLKPSNILVTSRDGVPVPKVIDFGIAKATTDQPLTDKTLFTSFEQFIGTPAYMSPEQAEMSELGTDTRSDIYSLGVLLYELLTGHTPFDPKDLLKVGLEAMRQTIREKEPVWPSTRLSTLVDGELATIANRRQTDAPKLIHLVRGDLDWIVMKCLEKDRARRYETANGLAMDLQRYLADEPIVARPPGNFYRFQKLVRRNKLAFAAAAGVSVALILGLAVSTSLLIKEWRARQRANAAEQKAQTAANKAQRVAEFLKRMLKGVGPSVAVGRDTKLLQEILDETAKSVTQELTNQPEVAVELCLTLADTYHDLGRYKEMEQIARQSLQLARAKLGEENEGVALSLTSLGDALQHLGETHQASLKEAEQCSRAGLEMSRKVLGNRNPKVALALEHLANVLAAEGRLGESEPLEREALAMYKKLIGPECPEVAKADFDLSLTLVELNKPAEAETMCREALAMQKKLLGVPHPEVAKTLRSLGNVFAAEGDYANAETRFREALAMWKELGATDRPDVADALTGLVGALMNQGRDGDAEPALRELIAVQRRILGNESLEVARLLDWLAGLLSREGKHFQAETTYREALAVKRKVFGNDHAEVASSLSEVADAVRRQGRPDEAEKLYREALAMLKRVEGTNFTGGTWTLENLVKLLEQQDRLGEAEEALRESIVLIKKVPLSTELQNSLLTQALNNLARVLRRQGKGPAAAAAWREALEHGDAGTLNAIAWQTATQPDPMARDGAVAVAFAEKAVSLTKRKEASLLDTLAAAYAEAGDFTNAVQVQREALAILQIPGWREAFAARIHRYEAHIPFREPELASTQVEPEAEARRATGAAHAQRGHFREAAVDFAKVIELNPDDHEVWHWQAATLIQAGQLGAYRELRRKCLERFGNTSDFNIAERTAKDYLIAPSTDAGLETASQLAETALGANPDHSDMIWIRLAKGLAEFRQGHFASAAEWMEKVLADAGPLPNRDAEASLVLAMARHQLKQTSQANAAFLKGQDILETKTPKLESGDLGPDWIDWVFAHALLNEAKTVVSTPAAR